MRISALLGILGVSLMIAGCSASMVSGPGSGGTGSPYAPVNEIGRPGLIKYLNQGAGSVVAKRREDAYRQMHAACQGPYLIDAEGPQEEDGMVIPMAGGGALLAQSQYWYIQFSCVRQ